MAPTEFDGFVRHVYWGLDKLLDAFEPLSPDQLRAEPIAGVGSAVDTLSHLLGFQSFWGPVLRGEAPLPRPRELPRDLADLRGRWAPVRADWLAFMAALTTEDLDRPVDVPGEEPRPTVRRVLSQFVQHEGQHRSELAVLATHFGRAPGNFDWWDFEPLPLPPPP